MPKILALYYGKELHSRYSWREPVDGLNKALEQLNGSMVGSGLSYTMDVVEIPIPALTIRTYSSNHIDHVDTTAPHLMDEEVWAKEWGEKGFQPAIWTGGGEIHVKNFMFRNNIIALINSGAYDEVWTAGLPIPAAFEGAMLAPVGDMGAYRAHDTLIYVPGLQRRFIWHMFSIENWNPLHNYWHRIEATMARIWSDFVGGMAYGVGYAEQWTGPRDMMSIKNYWQLFTMTENERLGEAQVGSCHFMPNAKLGYVSDMEDVVPSSHKLWYSYPTGFPMNLSSEDRFDMVSVADWKGRPDYVWQFEHIPRASGMFDNRWANWWKYIVDVNVSEGRDTATTLPWSGTPKSLVPTVATSYGEGASRRVVLRWERHLNDPNDCVYEVSVDDILRGTLQRRGEMHIKLSKDVPLGNSYMIALPGVWTAKYDTNVPTPGPGPVVIPPIVVIGGTLTIAQVKAILESMHAAGTPLSGCPKPRVDTEDTNNVYAKWGDITLTIQKKWTDSQLRQFYGLLYPKQLCGTVVVEPPIEPPIIVPSGKLSVELLTQIVNSLHTLPALVNCPKPTYTQDPATGDFLLHWIGGIPPMRIDKEWNGMNISPFYLAMYPKTLCSGVVVDPVVTPPIVNPPVVPPVVPTTLVEWVRMKKDTVEDELDMWERLLDHLS